MDFCKTETSRLTSAIQIHNILYDKTYDLTFNKIPHKTVHGVFGAIGT